MKRFHYPLDTILKQYGWEIDSLKMELMTLNQVLTARKKELDELQGKVTEAEQQIMEMYKENAIIALDRKRVIENYLHEQRSFMVVKQEEINQTQALVDNVFVQLQKKRQSQRAIEKHRERTKHNFDAEKIRIESLEADDLWLAKFAAAKQDA